QEEADLREEYQQQHHDDVDQNEPGQPPEDGTQRYRIADDALDDEGVEPDRRRQQADLQQHHHQNAHPDHIEPGRLEHRQQNWERDEHDADRVEEHAEDQIDDHHEENHGIGARIHGADKRAHEAREAAQGQEARQQHSTDRDEEDRRTTVQRINNAVAQDAP